MISRSVFLCAFLHLVVCSPPLTEHQLQIQHHHEHVEHITHFMCHAPQPRVFSVQELFPTETEWKAFFPDVTVLHRCESLSGVCSKSGHRCGPVRSTKVDLPFKVTFLKTVEDHKAGQWAMESYEFVNHTECGCAPPPPPTQEQMCSQLRESCISVVDTCSQLQTSCLALSHHYHTHHQQHLDHQYQEHQQYHKPGHHAVVDQRESESANDSESLNRLGENSVNPPEELPANQSLPSDQLSTNMSLPLNNTEESTTVNQTLPLQQLPATNLSLSINHIEESPANQSSSHQVTANVSSTTPENFEFP